MTAWNSLPRRILLLLALSSAPVAAQQVQEVRWGFDGRAPEYRFVPLSLLLFNDGSEPFEGPLLLECWGPAGARVGAPLVESCFLAPATGRWVQFHPYVIGGLEWRLGIGPRRRVDLPGPRLAPPATVLLAHRDELALGGGLPTFPVELLPPTVAALDALEAVVIDRPLRLEGTREQALLDWLRRGGTVHLLEGEGATPPSFGGALAVLEDPRPSFRVGAGRVLRHPVDLARFDPPMPESAPPEREGFLGPDAALIQALRASVQPEHNWRLLFTAAGLFAILAGPVHWRLSRRRLDYRWSILSLVTLVAVFTGILAHMGRRGYGEEPLVQTLAVGRWLGGPHYDVTGYTSLFTTRGDVYELRPSVPFGLLSTAQAGEPVARSIANGRDSVFLADIPLYSHRGLLHRGRYTLAEPEFEVDWPGRDRGDLESFALLLRQPPAAGIRAGWVFHDRWAAPLVPGDGRLEAGRARLFGRLFDLEQWSQPQLRMPDREEAPAPEELLTELEPRLLAHGLGLLHQEPPDRLTGPDEVVVALVLPLPEPLRLKGRTPGREIGRLLLLWRIPLDSS